MTLNAIKSRLGSISPTALERLPPAVQKLLATDMPKLIKVADSAHKLATDNKTPNEELVESLMVALMEL